MIGVSRKSWSSKNRRHAQRSWLRCLVVAAPSRAARRVRQRVCIAAGLWSSGAGSPPWRPGREVRLGHAAPTSPPSSRAENTLWLCSAREIGPRLVVDPRAGAAKRRAHRLRRARPTAADVGQIGSEAQTPILQSDSGPSRVGRSIASAGRFDLVGPGHQPSASLEVVGRPRQRADHRYVGRRHGAGRGVCPRGGTRPQVGLWPNTPQIMRRIADRAADVAADLQAGQAGGQGGGRARPTSRPACAPGPRDCWSRRRSRCSSGSRPRLSGTLVLPNTLAPAAASRWTASALLSASHCPCQLRHAPGRR